MTEHGHKLVDDAIVVVRGRLDARDDIAKFIAQEIDIFDVSQAQASAPIRVQLPMHAQHPRTLDALKVLLGEHPGDCEVLLHLDDRQVIRLPDPYTVDTRNGLVAELRELLGPDAVIV